MLNQLQDTFSNITRTLGGKSKINEKNIEEVVEQIKTALLEADVNLRVVRRFVNATAEEARGEKVLKSVEPGQQFVKIIYDKMVDLLGGENNALTLKNPDVVSTILLLGLQGAGKTTQSAKLANKLKKDGRRPLLVAADLQRPAAVEQLKILGASIGVEVFTEESDVVKRVEKAIAYAKKHQLNTVIVDTAGRLDADEALMSELKNIIKACNPDEKLLVADAMTGQAAVDVASSFHEQVGLSGIILSKFDSDSRGGAALSIKSITGQAIKFVGTGEKIDDFDTFYPDRVASRILGMGDIVSLVEKAQESIDMEDALKFQEKMISASFSLEDYLAQMQQVKKMGKMGDLAKLLPGVSASDIENNFDEKAITREEAIILSMTKKERLNPLILNPSRRKRIANGSGLSSVDVNRFLTRFEKMKIQMKKLSKNKEYQAYVNGLKK